MKKNVFLAFVATSLLMASCASCGDKKPQGLVLETETDSIFMPNDSTVADLQTFIYQGLMPMDNGTVADYILTIKSLGWEENGNYTVLSTVTTDTAVISQQDNGESIVIVGIPSDSTVVIYQLISANNNPPVHLMAHGDSALVKINKDLQPVSKNAKHKLIRKK